MGHSSYKKKGGKTLDMSFNSWAQLCSPRQNHLPVSSLETKIQPYYNYYFPTCNPKNITENSPFSVQTKFETFKSEELKR